MHMSDALLSPVVCAATGAASLALLAVAARRLKQGRSDRNDTDEYRESLVPLMGVMGAFVFAAQMINFSIPGTGSSGHLVGGILLAAVLGPWAAFVTLSSVVVLQCLLFADGGFLALGANLLNMAALSCLVAYPAVFRPVVRPGAPFGRILLASISAGIVAFGLGAVAVTLETEASGITALPPGRFLLFMLPIHLVIGIGEGVATAAILAALYRYRTSLSDAALRQPGGSRKRLRGLFAIAAAALLVGTVFPRFASSDPDGLEWSVERVAGSDEIVAPDGTAHRTAAAIQRTTALMPDYDTSLAGLVGSGLVVVLVVGAARIYRTATKRR